MSSPGRLLLLDSASLYFRAFFGIPKTLTAPDGTAVNALRGILEACDLTKFARRPYDVPRAHAAEATALQLIER